MSFLLTKWYLDCVSADGQAFIGYWGEIRWRGLAFCAAQTLRRDESGRLQSVTRSGRVAPPVLADGELRWVQPGLGMDGVWRASSPAVHRRLLDSPQGFVDWHCEMPGACAEIRFRRERASLRGRGYAEFLQMTLPPWRLPVEELRWGRFHSDLDTVVWIQWRGPHPLCLILSSGKIWTEDAAISEDRVSLPGAVLDLAGHTVLRTGPIVSTALARLPLLKHSLPGRFLALDETKWISQGTVHDSGGDSRRGWAIHEVVRWP